MARVTSRVTGHTARTVIALMLAVIIFWNGGALAQAVDVDRLSKADAEKLTPEQSKTLPAFAFMNKFAPEMTTGMKRFVPLMLRDLGYGFRDAFTGNDEQLRQWVTQFQHDIGSVETGILTMGELDTLTKRSSAVERRAAQFAVGG
jgi:hypothetical protein